MDCGSASQVGAEVGALRCPPLSCRTSPPQGGRSARHRCRASLAAVEGWRKRKWPADLPPCGGDVRQDRGGRRRSRKPDSANSIHPLHLRQVVGLDRRVLPQAFDLGVPHADLRQLEQEAVDRVVGQDLLRLLVELGALGLVGGQVQLVDDLVEGRVVVVEVIVLARIDIDVVGLGVRDDGEVVVLVGEDLLQPVGPFDRDDLQLDADLAQLRGDDLAAIAGIGDRRQLQRRLEAIGKAGLLEQFLRLGEVEGIGAGQVDIGGLAGEKCEPIGVP